MPVSETPVRNSDVQSIDKMHVGYQRRKLIQMVAQSLPGSHRRCVHHGGHTGSLGAES